jgi:hypothetical protein
MQSAPASTDYRDRISRLFERVVATLPLLPSIPAHVLNAFAALELPVNETDIGFAFPTVTAIVEALSMFVRSVKMSAAFTSAETVSSELSPVGGVRFPIPALSKRHKMFVGFSRA